MQLDVRMRTRMRQPSRWADSSCLGEFSGGYQTVLFHRLACQLTSQSTQVDIFWTGSKGWGQSLPI